MSIFNIEKIYAREILDSRGIPTIEVQVSLPKGIKGKAMVPSGDTVSLAEKLEFRDKDSKRYNGQGVLQAVELINNMINPLLCGQNAFDIHSIDNYLLEMDGTPNLSKLGANVTLAISIASCKAVANALGQNLFTLLGGKSANTLPVPLIEVISGGAHCNNNIDIQEFMIVPLGASNFKEAIQASCEVYYALKELLEKKGISTCVSQEGGFSPNVDSDDEAIELILKSIQLAGYTPGLDFMIAIDACANQWKTSVTGKYFFPKKNKYISREDLIYHWKSLIEKYPIISIEDPLEEEDWKGWVLITKALGNKIQLVGDDLFATNPELISKGISLKCANSICIKPNQIGTVSQLLDTIKISQKAKYSTILSHRSGETNDTFISDLAVALNCSQIKAGAPSRGERVCKYNQLLRIEEELGKSALYAGFSAFDNI